MAAWYLLVHRIPPRPLYLRAKIRQRLANVGAIALKNSVYLLPRSDETREDFEWIAEEIRTGGGEAHIFEGDVIEGIDASALHARFRAERGTDYEALTVEIRSMRQSTGTENLAAEHARLTRRLEEIQSIDFFESAGRAAAEALLSKMASRIKAGRKEEKRTMKTKPELRGKIWTTRPNVKVDRIASAWFIRRFVDPKARFRFVDPASPRAKDEIRFDMVGGDFTHEEDRCTFETLTRRIGLPDRGVQAIAEIVHDIDLKDEKFARAEASGVRKLIEGLISRTSDDAQRIAQGLAMFDDLHAALRPRRGGKRT